MYEGRRLMRLAPHPSLLTKAFRLLDGQVEFFHQLVVGPVGRKVEAVEAGVAPRQPSLLPHLLYAEALWAVAPWERDRRVRVKPLLKHITVTLDIPLSL